MSALTFSNIEEHNLQNVSLSQSLLSTSFLRFITLMRFGSCTLTDIVLEFIKIKNYTFQRYSRHLQDVESAPLWWM